MKMAMLPPKLLAMRFHFVVNIALAVLLLTGCRIPPVEIPDDVLAKDAMVDIMEDVYLAEGGRAGGVKMFDDAVIGDYYDLIFEKHNTDKETFEKTFIFYSEQPAMMLEIHDRVIRRLMEREAQMAAKKTDKDTLSTEILPDSLHVNE
jgi:hypothetical protein